MVCIGQSNMEMPLDGFGEPVFGSRYIGKSINPQIRLITVERNCSSTPLVNFKGKWKSQSRKLKIFAVLLHIHLQSIFMSLWKLCWYNISAWGGTTKLAEKVF